MLESAASRTPAGAGRVLRRVAGEPALILGAPCALLMLVAHPKIAAAVADHNDLRARPWLRLWKTLDAMVLLVFGSEHQRRGALRPYVAPTTACAVGCETMEAPAGRHGLHGP